MDHLFHLIFGYFISGGNLLFTLGCILPDILYILSTPFAVLGYKDFAYRLWLLGERLHSFFVFPLFFLILLPFLPAVLWVLSGVLLHLLLDLLTHAQSGPRYLYPLMDMKISSGPISWSERSYHGFSLLLSFIMILIMVIL